MSAGHTPGPWRLQIVESDTGRIRHLCPMDDEGLSLLTVVEHAGKKFAAVYEEADAALIASAPDLLAERDRLKAANAELSIDAARYRFLRTQAIEGEPGQPVIAMPNGMSSGYYLNEETADFAVDASMAARAALVKNEGATA